MAGVMWDPELQLSLGRSADAQSTAPDSSSRGGSVEQPFSATSAHQLQRQKQQQKQITMIYNGQICVYDVTEIQARSIISMAKREMDGKVEQKSRQQRPPAAGAAAAPSPPAALQQLLNPTPTGLSMKRSLQRFLEKRKTRADAASPYSHERPFFFLIKS